MNMNRSQSSDKLRVIFVGSFFDASSKPERGGMHVDCETLTNSPIREQVDFIPFDTTNATVPAPPWWQRLLHSPRRIARYMALLVQRKPHCALIYSSGGLSFAEKAAMTLLTRALGIPVVLSIRAGAFQDQYKGSRAFRWFAKPLLRTPRLILCQGDSWADFYSRVAGVSRDRLLVIPNWIDLARFAPSIFRAQEPRGTPLRLLFVGWVNRAKGIFELLDAVKVVNRKYGVTLEVVGKGNDFDLAVSHVAADEALAHCVRFRGWLSGDDLLDCYRSAHVFVLPTYAEGFPNAVLEAMAMELPVITTPVGGIPDVVHERRNGLLIAPGSVEELATAIEYMANNREARHAFASSNRDQVVANHDVHSLWPTLLDAFRRVAAATAPVAAKSRQDTPGDGGPCGR